MIRRWSAALQPPGLTTGASAPLSRSASCLALVPSPAEYFSENVGRITSQAGAAAHT
jgi:hypothetical protein